MTPSGIKPATFRFVEQCLNQLRHGVPLKILYAFLFSDMLAFYPVKTHPS
jgi:hypothetical protein